MPFEATVYRVLIASPSDVGDERQAVSETIHRWNATHAKSERVVLLPVMWETDARPQTGGRPQGFVNQQLGDSDILIGLFWSRLGTPTGKEESGTVEEIKEFLNQSKPVMLYFSERDIPQHRFNSDQFSKLQEFKAWCQENSLYWTFDGIPELRERVSSHLTQTVRDLHTQDVLSGETDDSRRRRLEAMTLQQARSEHIRELAGDSPLAASFAQKDMSRKACLSLVGRGYRTTPEHAVEVKFALENEGEWPARDVVVSVNLDLADADQASLLTDAPAALIEPQKAREFAFTLPPAIVQADTSEEQSWTFGVDIRFRDGVGIDSAAFVFTLSGRFPNFIYKEDPSQARLSRLCRYVRPIISKGRFG